MAKFNERLKELRKSYTWSQDTLAEKLGTTRSCVGNYEQGLRKPDIEALEQIADLFNVDMAYLIGKQESKRLISFDNGCDTDPIKENLINNYNQLSDDSRKNLLAHSEMLLKVDKVNKEESEKEKNSNADLEHNPLSLYSRKLA